VTRLFELAGINHLPDVTSSAIVSALGRPREQGFATRTVAAYATALKSFFRWAWKNRRTARYALSELVKPSDPNDRRRIRRLLTVAELRTLIDTTQTAPAWRGVTGVGRSMMYAIAASGLRRNEPLSSTPESFRLDQSHPMLVCEVDDTSTIRKPSSLFRNRYCLNRDPGLPPSERVTRYSLRCHSNDLG
jgi:site-specific recombinase XerD